MVATAKRATKVPGEAAAPASTPDTEQPARPKEGEVEAKVRLDFDRWTDRTTAEAKAAGVKRSVLCKDGWYVPDGQYPVPPGPAPIAGR